MKKQAERLDTLARAVLDAREEKETIEAELLAANKRVREAEAKLIEAMRETGITAFKTAGLNFGRTTRLSVKKIDEQALFRWLQGHGYEGVIRETVHPRTLERVVRETLEAEGRMPSGVEASEYDVLSIRKS